MTKVFIPAWGEQGADKIVALIEVDGAVAQILAIGGEFIFVDREPAEKQARELMARDDITWPIHVYERELSFDPFKELETDV